MIQYAIIGKIVYALCKMDSKRLRKIAKELSVLSKVKKSVNQSVPGKVNQKKTRKLTKKSKKGRMKKGSAEAKAWGRKMKRLRNGR